MKILGKHHVRATFYHLVAIIFLITTALWLMGFVNDKWSLIITIILFVSDYIAEMYDPHPDNPGPWFKMHFHRFYDNDDNDNYEKCELTELINKQNLEAEKFFKKVEEKEKPE